VKQKVFGPVELVFRETLMSIYFVSQGKLASGTRAEYHPKVEAKAKKIRRKMKISCSTCISCQERTKR
jgi:hypothetical protein